MKTSQQVLTWIRQPSVPLRAVVCGMLVAAALATSPGPSSAGSIRELRLGILNHDTDGLWSGFRREHGPDLNAEIILDFSAGLFGGALRPAIGGTFNTRGDTSKIYACGRWEYEWPGGMFVALGFGGAVHDGKTSAGSPNRKALGSRLLFHSAFELGYAFTPRYSLSLYFDHVSNAGLADENDGMDTLGIRCGVRF